MSVLVHHDRYGAVCAVADSCHPLNANVALYANVEQKRAIRLFRDVTHSIEKRAIHTGERLLEQN